ncbi:MAG TPA: chain length determinant protein EpsF [Burkholderiales bacterium]|nr:chain length determinant protein EpsF [Burkholderiales bacterium]
MNLTALFSILRARMKLILLVLGGTVATALLVSLIMSPVYRATATVLIDIKNRDPVSGATLPQQLLGNYIATQVDIIASPHVATKVIDSLRLAESPKAKENFQEATGGRGDIRDWMAQSLLGKLEVEPSHDSNAISISYKASDPEQAARIANAFAAAYMDANMELRIDPAKRVSGWYGEQITQLRAELEKVQGQLTAFQRERGLVASDERLDVETARLNELSTQLVSAQTATFDTASRKGQNTNAHEVMNSLVVQQLRTELAKRESELAQLEQSLGKNHPSRQRLKADVDALRSRLYAEMGNAGAVVSTGADAAKQREASLRDAVEKQKARVLELKQQRDEASLLMRDVENAQRVYDGALQRYGQVRLESRNNQTDIAVLNVAKPPLEADSPRILLNVVLAVFLGGMLAVGLAFLLETLDRRIRAPEDLSEVLGIPVLGVFTAARPALSQRRLALPKLR